MAKPETPKASGDTADQTPKKSGSPRIPIAMAYLHSSVMLPEGGGTEAHLGKPHHNLTLEWGPEGLWVIQNNGKPTIIVPQANVKNVVVK